ncbi:hypothetical protein PF008_g1936 [Phytophthora fragariae]|uniref:Uncharacterized protein n=1 Tax=Phytophthora fragariae TaxID=53985 RepID=A0A6G0SKE9_9STRA|nr:hypothetical protein PF008_g1936 [Phytophthora fragariae]
MPSVSLGKPHERQLPSTVSARSIARKPRYLANGKDAPTHGNNALPYTESQSELEAKRLAAQRTAMLVADRATAILKMQQKRDPDVLDLRPYAEELNDVLLTEMAHQLRANRAAGYSLLILSGCKGFTPVGLRSLVHAVDETLRQLDCSCTTLSVPMLQVLAAGGALGPQGCQALQFLNLEGLERISDAGMLHIVRGSIARQKEEIRELERLAVKLQSNWRGHRSRRNELVRVRAEAAAREVRQHAAASRINAGVRGYFGRRYARAERVRVQTRLRAACIIQRAWRRYSEPDPRQLSLNAMLMHLRKSALNEDAVARAQQAEILRKAKDLVNRDSASEPESDDDWRDFQDEYGDQFWFSPSRNERVYMRPNDHAREKSILEMSCRVLWPLEQRWFDGRVTRYNWKKDRHRIDYDDGDHEWLSLFRADSSRIQLFNGHCWCMAPMLDTSKRALRAAIFIGVYFQQFDPRRMCWRSGSIRAYHEPSDMFLLMYDLYDNGSGGSPQYEQEWVNVFQTENHFQVQDAVTRQWYSLSGYVFGHVRGRPLDLQLLQSKQSEGYWYSVADYLDYDEAAFAQAEETPADAAGAAADNEMEVEEEKEAGGEDAAVAEDESQSGGEDRSESGDEGDTEISDDDEEYDQGSDDNEDEDDDED